MITVTNKSRTFLLVPVPEETYGFELDSQGLSYCFMHMPFLLKLPIIADASYKLVGKANTLSENDWRTICETVSTGGDLLEANLLWKNYCGDTKGYDSATDSGLSLLRYHKFMPETCCLVEVLNSDL